MSSRSLFDDNMSVFTDNTINSDTTTNTSAKPLLNPPIRPRLNPPAVLVRRNRRSRCKCRCNRCMFVIGLSMIIYLIYEIIMITLILTNTIKKDHKSEPYTNAASVLLVGTAMAITICVDVRRNR